MRSQRARVTHVHLRTTARFKPSAGPDHLNSDQMTPNRAETRRSCGSRSRRIQVRSAMFLLCIAVISPAFPATLDDVDVDKIFRVNHKLAYQGCSLGVIRDGSFVYRRGYGEGSLELAVPLTSESVFYMGSVSKQFTAASIVILEHRGLLSLDDDVHKYIPELPDYGYPITLREMLHHTSGFRDYLGLLTLSGRDVADVYTFPELLDLVTRQKGLIFTPGD